MLFLREVLGGAGLGLGIGLGIHLMLVRTESYANQLLTTLGGVAFGYGVALQIDVSGPIAMVVAGLVATRAHCLGWAMKKLSSIPRGRRIRS